MQVPVHRQHAAHMGQEVIYEGHPSLSQQSRPRLDLARVGGENIVGMNRSAALWLRPAREA
jgi:hypothetical protein